MSLDVYLTTIKHTVTRETGIRVRHNGAVERISRQEWDARYPGHEPIIVEEMDEIETDEVYWANITHNLGEMAEAAGIYKALWRPEEIGIAKAAQLIEPLEQGLNVLRSDPEKFRAFNAPNGWGTYEGLVSFVEKYLAACREHPDADVSVSR